MKGRLINIIDKKKKRTKSIVLSVVALLELVLLLTSVTFSWFEGITSLEIIGNNIHTAAALNSHIEVGEASNPDDVTYTNVIDLTDFFDSQSDVRLSPVSSSDAETFYAAYDGVPRKDDYKSLHYRELTEEDINANIIRFDFQISSPHGDTDVYLTESLPVLSINGVEIPYTSTATATNGRKANAYRYAFSDGTETHILRTEDDLRNNISNTTTVQESIVSLKSDDTPVTVGSYQTSPKQIGTVERAQEYAYYTDHRKTTTGLGSTASGTPNGAEIKPLFHLDKGETKTITVTVWHEALDYESLNLSSAYTPTPGQKISFSIKLCTSWSISREIKVYDRTANWTEDYADAESHTGPIIDTKEPIYVHNNANKDEDDNLTGYQYELTYSSSEKCWKGKLPIALQDCQFVYKRNNSSELVTASAANLRDNNTVLTILGSGDKSCVWGLNPDDLTRIDFRDYTDLGWINNEDEKGNPIDISIGYTYNDIEAIRYNMTDNPVPDNFENNSWSCWLPNSVTETIRFFRSGLTSSGNYKDFNYWETDSRISQNNTKETVFRANDDKFTLYVYIDDAVINNTNVFKEFDSRAPQPYIAKTGSNNASYWHKTNINDISRYNYHPNDGDNWYGYDQISKANNNLWYITLDNRPALNDDFTIASKRMPEYNDINTETSFGVFRYTNSGNTIHITGAKEIGLANHTDNYILTGTFNTSINSIVGSTTSVSEKCYGVWGEAPSLPTGNTKNYFVHTSEVDFVKVHFKYNGVNYSITMKTDDGKTWYTDAIPTNGTSAVTTGITFSDSNGNSWTNTGTRNNLQNYYYVISENGANSTGTGWRFPINITTSDTYYFKHYDNNVQNLTVKYTVSGVPFTVNLTKGTDGLWSTNSIAQGVNEITFSDGTNSWTVSNSGTTYYYHAKDSNFGYWAKEIFLKPTIWDKDNAWFAVHVFNDSDSYESFQIKLAETGTSGVYSAWIPSDSNTKLVFVRMNPSETEFSWDDGKKWNQTGDVKIVNDSNTFIITGWGSGTWYENRVLHFKPNGKWGTTDVTFRAWVWGSSSLSDQWIYIDGPDANGNYITEIDPSYTDIIFLRANKNTTGWNGEKNRIQTKYNGANTFTVTSSTSGTWSDQ